MDHFLHNIRVAARSLARQKSFTLVALLTLALGTGATTAIFSVVNGVLLKPLPYADSNRIVSLWGTARDNPGPNVVGTVAHLNYLDWKREAKSFETMALYSAANFIVNGLGDADLVRGAIVTPDFFRVFKAMPDHGTRVHAGGGPGQRSKSRDRQLLVLAGSTGRTKRRHRLNRRVEFRPGSGRRRRSCRFRFPESCDPLDTCSKR